MDQGDRHLAGIDPDHHSRSLDVVLGSAVVADDFYSDYFARVVVADSDSAAVG